MSTNPIDQLFEDKRPIAEMAFGAEEKTPEARESTATHVRELLAQCEVAVADDINKLGCTGVLHHAASLAHSSADEFGPADKGAAIAAAKFLRLGLAGGGVGLPCFVPISRYCLVHETIGGLEPGQLPHHVEMVELISRELTPEEHGKVALVEMARRKGRRNGDVAADILGGRDESLLTEEPAAAVASPTPDMPTLQQQLYEARLAAGLEREGREQEIAAKFKCPEHTKFVWACRHCVAQAVVEGSLEPLFFVTSGKPGSREVTDLGPGQALGNCVIARAVEAELSNCEARGDTEADVFVRVATYTRRLARN